MAANDSSMSVINVLVPFGQLGIGIGLILGLLTRFSAAMGTLMMLFFFVAAWDFEFGIVNQHLTYALVTAFLGLIGAGNFYGLDRRVGESAPPWVRRWLLSGTPGAAAGTDPCCSRCQPENSWRPILACCPADRVSPVSGAACRLDTAQVAQRARTLRISANTAALPATSGMRRAAQGGR